MSTIILLIISCNPKSLNTTMRSLFLLLVLILMATISYGQTTYKEWWVEVKPGKGQAIIDNTTSFFDKYGVEFSSGGWAIRSIDTRGSIKATHRLIRFGDYKIQQDPWSEEAQSAYNELWQQNFSMVNEVVKDQQAIVLVSENYTQEILNKYPFEKVYEISVGEPSVYLEAFIELWNADDIKELWQDRPYGLSAVTTGHENSITHRVHVSFENWRDMYEMEEAFFSSQSWADYMNKDLEVEIISTMTSILRARYSSY